MMSVSEDTMFIQFYSIHSRSPFLRLICAMAGISLHLVQSLLEQPRRQTGTLRYESALKDGFVSIYDPRTQKTIKSDLGFYFRRSVFYYFKKVSRQKSGFIVVTSPFFMRMYDAVLIKIPLGYIALIAHKKDTHEYLAIQKSIADFFNRKNQNWLQNKKRASGVVAVLDYMDNFADSLLYQMSALDEVVTHRMLPEQSALYVVNTIFPVMELYPELQQQHIRFEQGKHRFARRIHAQGTLPIQLQKLGVAPGVIQRCKKYADHIIPKTKKQQINQFRNNHSLCLVVTLRDGMQKRWLEQNEGLVALINKLHDDFSNIGIIFDGYSPTTTKEDAPSIIEKQQKSVQYIQQKIRYPEKTCSIIGWSLFETMYVAQHIDMYLSVHGTSQHKWGWFSNVPGVIHGPAKRMKQAQFFDGTAAQYAINDPVLILSPKPQQITSVSDDFNADYYCDWQILYEQIRFLCEGIKTGELHTVSEWNKYIQSSLYAKKGYKTCYDDGHE